ncbi:MAG: hypothetical protein ACRETJ_00165, partial [Steroidobacteraceae bacterium]
YGLISFGGKSSESPHPGATSIILLTPDGRIATGTLHVSRERPKLLVLRDGSVLVLGGTVGLDPHLLPEKISVHTNAVEHLTLSGGLLTVERLPDLPGAVRTGVSYVELADGRIMALGGSTSPYIGTAPMSADTYILDLKQKSWSVGPQLLHARDDASATLLPDGSVLVAGGWIAGLSDGAGRSTERWDPKTNQFVPAAPLPIGVASHQAVWAAGLAGKQLLVFGGVLTEGTQGNRGLAAFDVDAGVWRSVGMTPASDNRTGECFVFSALVGGRTVLWWYYGRAEKPWIMIHTQLPSALGEPSPPLDAEKGLALPFLHAAFVPPAGGSPGILAGGLTLRTQSAAAEAVWEDGRTLPLPALNETRAYAQAFRLTDGSFLVAGGFTGDWARRTARVPPPELLAVSGGLNEARWSSVDLGIDGGAALGQSADGSLIAVESDAAVARLKLTVAADGKLIVQRTMLPPLPDGRKQPKGDGVTEEVGENMVIRGLADGRIVVAGGVVPRDTVAVLSADSGNPGAPDELIGIGDDVPAQTYDIYEPSSGRWRQSASAEVRSRSTAIFADGRVVTWGLVPGLDDSSENAGSTRPRALLQVSLPDGRSWTDLDGASPAIALSNPTSPVRVRVIDEQLFISGSPWPSPPRPASGPTIDLRVQWLDTGKRQWQTVWEQAILWDWDTPSTRIIERDLSNGQHVVLTVGDLDL